MSDSRIRVLQNQEAALEESIQSLMAEIDTHRADLSRLSESAFLVTVRTRDKELLRWLNRSAEEHIAGMHQIMAVYDAMSEELETTPEDDFEARRLQLEHLIAVEENVQEKLKLEKAFLLKSIEQLNAKLKPSATRT